MRNQKMLRAAMATRAVIDASWIPEELRGNRFFSVEDIWTYVSEWGDTTCEACKEFALGVPFFPGNQLRSSFPWLEIEDENTIAANVHPNCKCKLLREGTEEPKSVLSKREAKLAFVKGEI